MVQNEKRKTVRRKVHVPVLCWDDEEGRRTGKGEEIVCKDLSGDGIAFSSQKVYPIGACLFIDIYLPNQKDPISCGLKVVSVEALLHKEEFLIGAAFFDIEAEDRIRIASSLEKMDLYVLLESALTGGASDLHLTVGRPPMVRRSAPVRRGEREPHYQAGEPDPRHDHVPELLQALRQARRHDGHRHDRG